MCGNIDLAAMLNKAEGLFHQIKEAEHLTNEVRLILGLPLVRNNNILESSDEISPSDISDSTNGQQLEKVLINGDEEVSYERAISNTFL